MNIFQAFAGNKSSPLACDRYMLSDTERLSDDGLSVVCTECGDVKMVKTYSSLFACDVWTFIDRTGGGACTCERRRIAEESKKKDEEVFRTIYNSDRFRGWVGSKYLGVDLETLVPADNNRSYEFGLKACRRYVENSDTAVEKGQGIYVYSQSSGTGKTTLLAGVRNALIKKQVKCIFINVKDLMNEAGKRGDEDYSKTLYNYSMFLRIPVLILDDIGAIRLDDGRYGRWVNETLYELIERRCRNKLSTCFTSNYSPKQLQEKRGVDFKTVDRINELSTLVVELTGGSLRGRNKNMDTNTGDNRQ